MTVIGLHPEELLERERDQALSPAERSLLDAHLRACPACRLLRLARDDFAAERAALGTTGPEARWLGPMMVDEFERYAREPRLGPAPTGVAGPPVRRFGFGRRAWLVAAALLVGGSAAAASGHVAGWWSPSHTPVRASAGAPAPRPPPAVMQAVSAVTTPAANSAEASARACVSVDAEPGGVVRRAEPSPVNREAADLFERARQARVQSNYQAALQSYRELERRYPTSAESRASRAIVARILLDTGQSEAALVDLDRYLAEGPAALTEEVMVSRGLAYERLGQPAEERKAWQSLLRAYPGSMYGTRARARLRALDAGR